MDEKRLVDVRRSLGEKATTELLQIWTSNDRDEYSAEAFEAIRQILAERGEALPEQAVREEVTSSVPEHQVAEAISKAAKLRPSLRLWFRVYLGLLLGALALVFAGLGTESDFLAGLGGLLLFAALIPYACSIVYAYRLQSVLNKAGLYKHGAWQVIVGALILNPWVLGFWIPLSVSKVAKKVIAAGVPTAGLSK